MRNHLTMRKRDLEAMLRENGYAYVRSSKSKEMWRNKDNRTVALQRNKKEIGGEVLREIFKCAGWSLEQASRDKQHRKAVDEAPEETCAEKEDESVQEAERREQFALAVAMYAEKNGTISAAQSFKIPINKVKYYCDQMEVFPAESGLDQEVNKIGHRILELDNSKNLREIGAEFNISYNKMWRIGRGEHSSLSPELAERLALWWRNRPPQEVSVTTIQPIETPKKEEQAMSTPMDKELTRLMNERDRMNDVLLCTVELCVRMYGADEDFLRRFLKMSANIELPALKK